MPWTYADLKAADAALPGVPLSLAAAVTTLNAQTVVLPARDLSWSTIRDVLMDSHDWGALVAASLATVGQALPGGTLQTIAIRNAAVSIRERSLYGSRFRSSDDTVWASLTDDANLLTPVGVGAISQASAGAVVALRTPTVPKWQPAVTTQDITAARIV